MKSLLLLLCPTVLLTGCVAVPYEADGTYYPGYATTVTTHVSGGYYYPERHYPYAVPNYSYPYPVYPYHQAPVPAYRPPAPVIVPPRLEHRHERHDRPAWRQERPPQHDRFRDGPRPDWSQRSVPTPQWERPGNTGPEWQRRNGPSRGDNGAGWHGDRKHNWQQDSPRNGYQQR